MGRLPCGGSTSKFLPFLLLGSFALFAIYPASASEPQTFDRMLAVSGPVSLDVNTGHGGIKISKGSDDKQVRIHAVIRPLYGRLDGGLAAASIQNLQNDPPIEQTGTHIRIGYTQSASLRLVSMTVTIELPSGSEIKALTTSGGISLDGPFGPIKTLTHSGQTEISNSATQLVTAESQSGGILIRNIEGNVSVRTESGSVQVMGVKGALDLRSQSGRLEASESSGDVHVTTHSGSISVDNASGQVSASNVSGSIDAFQLSGPVHAETSSGAIHIAQRTPAPIRALARSGAIHVQLASRQGYMIDAQSQSGKIAGSFVEAANVKGDSHRFQEAVAGGGPLIDLDTRSSKIEID